MTPDSNYGHPKCKYQNPIKIKAVEPKPRKILNGQFECKLKYQIPAPPKTMPAPDWHEINKIASSSNNDDNATNTNNWQPRMRGGDEGK